MEKTIKLLEFQTRGENDGLRFFETLKEAMDFANSNPDIWKVSFSLPNGEGVRLVKETDGTNIDWIYEPIILSNME